MPRKSAAAVFDQIAEQLKFASREINSLAVPRDFSSAKVDSNWPELIRVRRQRYRRCRCAPHKRFDSGQQFDHLKRLRNIVVSSKFQADDLVHHLSARSQHQYRRRDAELTKVAA